MTLRLGLRMCQHTHSPLTLAPPLEPLWMFPSFSPCSVDLADLLARCRGCIQTMGLFFPFFWGGFRAWWGQVWSTPGFSGIRDVEEAGESPCQLRAPQKNVFSAILTVCLTKEKCKKFLSVFRRQPTQLSLPTHVPHSTPPLGALLGLLVPQQITAGGKRGILSRRSELRGSAFGSHSWPRGDHGVFKFPLFPKLQTEFLFSSSILAIVPNQQPFWATLCFDDPKLGFRKKLEETQGNRLQV